MFNLLAKNSSALFKATSRGFATSTSNADKSYKIVFLRHGESAWNKENRFTGWYDVKLNEDGKKESSAAGKKLKQEGYEFDLVFTSVLQRTVQTYNIAVEELSCHHLPVIKSWRLNERHYGALQGLNKSETAAKHGEDQVKIWRRSYDIPPPALELSDERHPRFDSRYQQYPLDALPRTECLKDTVARVLPFWTDHIGPAILQEKRVLIVAHGNSIRAMVKYLDNVSDKDIIELNIPTAVPLVYELDHNLKPKNHYYLMDEEELKKKMAGVAAQGKAK